MSPGATPQLGKNVTAFRISETSSPRPLLTYPAVPAVRYPPAAYVNQKNPSEPPRTDSTRMQSSVSSADSASSAYSYQKQYPSQQPLQSTPVHDQTVVDGDPDRNNGQWEPKTPRRTPAHSPRRQEMTENNSAVLRYIREQDRVEEEDDIEDDHAPWILVSGETCFDICVLLADCLQYSSGYHSSTRSTH